MKLRTLEQFEDALSRDLAWRRRELTTIRLTTQASRSHVADMMVRSGVALLYAHWEGFCGAACRAYLEFVRQKGLRHDQLSVSMLAVALRSKMLEFGDAKAAWVHRDFANFIRTCMKDKASINSELVSTKSNLSSEVLRDLAIRTGMDYSKFELRANLIDERLLANRNKIAHGEEAELDVPAYVALHDDVVKLISDVHDELAAAARAKTYLA